MQGAGQGSPDRIAAGQLTRGLTVQDSGQDAVSAADINVLDNALGYVGGFPSGDAGDGGRAVARVSVAPGTVLTVRVGGPGQAGTGSASAAGGFNGLRGRRWGRGHCRHWGRRRVVVHRGRRDRGLASARFHLR